ncbi:hypothetical protein CKM354_000780300 [Cercospora kikuchii]|uniref:NAD dependent epimerase/dehydratase n=1 Tax=Cercospora kikuchii TaxID=84275 RepID=A0A9P3FJ22_9PEZI|nr:uncharacterized protein CKM354_000780300 [Cercospora kikuchii]GIZ44609.1 hypothetical protein CKM354_000780300 [Cercospora kikuchii]
MTTEHKTQPPPRRPIVFHSDMFGRESNIDRRQCKRVVPLKVICLGLSRTGTSSLRQALLDLNYADVYHYASIHNENPRDADMWHDAFNAKFRNIGRGFGREQWDQLLGHCMAVTDTPCVLFWRELLEAYPDAKVILTYRDSPEQWHRSVSSSLIDFALAQEAPKSCATRFFMLFAPADPWRDAMRNDHAEHSELISAVVRDYKRGTTEEGVAFYNRHYEEVKKMVPKERLLEMNIKEGCEKPLCDFLGEEMPSWEFPRTNTTDETLRNTDAVLDYFRRLVYWNMAKTFESVAALGAIDVAWWMRSRS